MPVDYSIASKEYLQDEFGQKYHYLVEFGIQTTQIAAALNIDVSNLIGYANREKPKSVSRALILALLKKLNRKFQRHLVAFVGEYPPAPTEGGANEERRSGLQARISSIEIHQQAITVLLVKYVAEARGITVAAVQAELDQLKKELTEKNYRQ